MYNLTDVKCENERIKEQCWLSIHDNLLYFGRIYVDLLEPLLFSTYPSLVMSSVVI